MAISLGGGFPRRSCSHWSAQPINFNVSQLGDFIFDQYEARFSSGAFAYYRKKLLSYNFFPTQLMSYQLCGAQRGFIQEGTVIVQGIKVGPLVWEAATRVCEFEEADSSLCFCYQTLRGHPEQGQAKFSLVRSSQEQATIFKIEAHSRAGHWFTRIFSPIIRAMQLQYTKAGMRHFSEQQDD